jgi:hypothetical protein
VRQAGQDLRLQIYPGADGAFEMYDGSRLEWQQAARCLRVSGVPSPRWLAVRCMASGAPPERIETAGGKRVELVPNSLGGDPGFVRFQADRGEDYLIHF